jgi:hypothetical protein
MLISNRLLTPHHPLKPVEGMRTFWFNLYSNPLIIFTTNLFSSFKAWWNTKHNEYEWSCSMNKIMKKLIIIIVMLSQASCDHIKTTEHYFSLFKGFINIFFFLFPFGLCFHTFILLNDSFFHPSYVRWFSPSLNSFTYELWMKPKWSKIK